MCPLVSIMMPCYNAAETLPWALASLLAQTYEEWECLLIDDGSTDGSLDVVSRVVDARIKVWRLERNMGRGVARQVALDSARGEFLCMLDADDWLYPTKIQRQIDILGQEPLIACVSSAMAVVDDNNALTGIRGRRNCGRDISVSRPFTSLWRTLFAFPPSMMRMSVAKQCSFDAVEKPGLGLPASGCHTSPLRCRWGDDLRL